jgi:oligopeptide/dipeptide ABC transporter ATP-binding protein
MNENQELLTINDLVVEFATEDGIIRALDKTCLSLKKGETLGLVGESGCGKSVTALSIMRLISKPVGKIANGQIYFHGEDLLTLPEHLIRKIRGNKVAMIFQEPMTSLNPVFTIGDQIMEVLRLHQGLSKKEALQKTIEMLDLVGIASPSTRVDNYPHQLSGGMRQRVMIAMALSCNPDLLIADEPTTALDVTIQAQIMDLMKSLQQKLNMSILLITHDLGVVAEMCDRVAVMYAGQIVEEASITDLFFKPKHPYTIGLLNSIPGYYKGEVVLGIDKKPRLKAIPGMVPNLLNIGPGCRFYERCFNRQDSCLKANINLDSLNNHTYRCLYPQGKI